MCISNQQEAKGQPLDSSNYDQKNIRRRVYDALNVLMAMNIISKDKKEIRWIGLPTNSAQVCLVTICSPFHINSDQLLLIIF